jgi:hypothetical protein
LDIHSPERFVGPDYPGIVDREHTSEARIIRYCDSFTEELVLPPERPRKVREFDPFAELDILLSAHLALLFSELAPELKGAGTE